MQQREQRRDTRRKVVAILAGGAALGLGISASLAAWTDTEWIFGGDGTGGPGIGTSTFSVQQNTATGGAPDVWTDEASNPGGEIEFVPGALALTPGDSVYAPVQLQTTSTSIAGEVELQFAVEAADITTNDPDDLLFETLQLRVVTSTTAFDCGAEAFPGGATPQTEIAAGALDSAAGTAPQQLAAASGSVQHYCFEISLPATLPVTPGVVDLDDYMGRTVAPAWEFQATSA